MYAYICRGLGVTAGAIGGWSLIWAYLGISIAGATGFTIFADTLLAMIGHQCAADRAVRDLRRARPGIAPGRTCSSRPC